MTYKGVTYTLNELVTELSIAMGDENHVRWTEAQKKSAIKFAVRKARPRWVTPRLDSSQTYDYSTRTYNLPPGCEGVSAVYVEDSYGKQDLINPSIWRMEGDNLVLSKMQSRHDGKTLYIYYYAYPVNLLDVSGADGYATADTDEFYSDSAMFVTDGVKVGDEIEIINGPTALVGTYIVKTVEDEKDLTIYGTFPDTSSGMDFTVAYKTDLPFDYLMYQSMAELYELASRNRPGLEVDENLRWSTYYNQKADIELTKAARHLAARRDY